MLSLSSLVGLSKSVIVKELLLFMLK